MTQGTSLHHNPPFRAEHLGSLLRPGNLLVLRDAVDAGKAKQDDLTPVEDQAVKDIVQTQLDLGFRAITDGEYRRHMFWGTFFPGLNGMKEVANPSADLFRPYMPDVAAFMEDKMKPGETVICDGKISHTGESTYMAQWTYLKSLVPADRVGELKLTLAAPEWYHMRYRQGSAYPKSVYADDKEYFTDIAAAYRKELHILYMAGLRNVQIDDPNFAYFCSEKMLAGWAADKDNIGTAEDLLDAYIALYNDCLSRRPADMHIGLHICRGNFVGSRHFSEGGYDAIAVKLFNRLSVDTYYLEYDTPRAGGFAPLAHLPANKRVVLGLVTSKFPQMEELEAMKRRVYEAAEIMGGGKQALDRLAVSPQCGFASHSGGNLVGHEDMVRKLELVRRIADEIWPGEA